MKNKPIKFRAWYNGKLHYNITKHHVEHDELSGWGGDVWDFSDWLKYAIVQEFTGLKDKNKKEVYEGDIIKQIHEGDDWMNKEEHEYIGVVKFSIKTDIRGYQSACFLTSVSVEGDAYNPLKNTCEVIGNIFENPELLKK